MIPQHVAIIMDGNRRWAIKHRMSAYEGHREGEKRIEPVIDEAIAMGVQFLTFWAFSTENWQRSRKEVSFLISLLRKLLEKKIDKFHLKNVKMKFIGDLSKFPPDIQERLQSWMEKTKNNKKITVNLALSYGGRDEIIRAINKWYKTTKLQYCKTEKINEEEFEKYLDTAGQPDPDLLIRTGGERRLSGFLLWQLEYTELYFTDLYWPDFTPQEFRRAIENYFSRQRRFGQ